MSSFAHVFRFSWFAGAVALLLAGSIGLAPAPARADSKKTVDSIAEMLKAGKFKSKQDGVNFILLFQGKGIGEFPVILTAVDDMIRIFSVVAVAGNVIKSPQLAATLLDINAKYPVFKVLLDPKGNLVLRYDIMEKMVDGDGLKKIVNDLADVTASFYKDAAFIKK